MTDVFDPQAILSYCGAVTRHARKAAKMSQRGLAKAIGLKTPGPLSEFEHGEKWLRQIMLLRIQHVLQLSASQFYPQTWTSVDDAIIALLPTTDLCLKEAVLVMLQINARQSPHVPPENSTNFSTCAPTKAHL